MRWLKANAPQTSLSIDFITTTPPAEHTYGDGITRGTVIGVQRGLRILQSAGEMMPALKNGVSRKINPTILSKIFIVHGHNELMKVATARFVDQLGLEPVILHEQPNGGRTIIEKFIAHSDVGFAIVLLSADDKGGTVQSAPTAYKLRARQNVIFELGFFIGKLGRSHVVALHNEDVEIPSDYSGVLFVPFDSAGVWRFQLAKEMRAAGIKVDLNKI